MTPNGLEALALVSKFLTQRLLPAVPPALTSELRAAIKLLDTARDELDVVYPLLIEECRELIALCRDAHTLLGELAASCDAEVLTTLAARTEIGFADLSALMACHREVCEWVSAILLALQRVEHDRPGNPAVSAMLLRFCAVLGRYAERRLPWQIIFAPVK
jgi:hypothetical protein